MVCGRFKSRTFRRIFKKTPGGRNVMHYVKRKVGKPSCTKCTKELQSTARGRKAEIKKIPKSARRPERPFGGVLCSTCARLTHIAKARV